jgi:predicted amidohydrolase
LFLPEASDYIAGSAAETVSLAARLDQSPFVNGLKTAARAYGLAICVGIHEPSDDGTKVKNCLLWISESGDICHKYQKIHLFDVDLENGPRLKESKYEADSNASLLTMFSSVEAGASLAPPFQTSIGVVGMLICFDVRMS